VAPGVGNGDVETRVGVVDPGVAVAVIRGRLPPVEGAGLLDLDDDGVRSANRTEGAANLCNREPTLTFPFAVEDKRGPAISHCVGRESAMIADGGEHGASVVDDVSFCSTVGCGCT